MQTGSPVSWFISLDSNFIPETIIHFVSAGLDFLSVNRDVIMCRIQAKVRDTQSSEVF